MVIQRGYMYPFSGYLWSCRGLLMTLCRQSGPIPGLLVAIRGYWQPTRGLLVAIQGLHMAIGGY